MASSPRRDPGRGPARVVFRPACTSAIPTTTSSSSPCTIGEPDVPSPLSFRGAPRSTRQLHTDVRRQIDRNEPVTRVQIVLPALVDDSEVATFQGASVSDHSIDLVELEGRRVLRIVDTENEAGAGLRPALDEPRRHTNASVALRQAQDVLGEVVEDHLLRDGRALVEAHLAPEPLDVELLGVAEAAVGLQRDVARLEP